MYEAAMFYGGGVGSGGVEEMGFYFLWDDVAEDGAV